MTNKIRISIDLERDVHKAFRLIATMQDKKMADIIRNLIEDYIVKNTQ